MYYVSGFLIWGAAAVASVPEPSIFDKGLIFVKDTDNLLSGDKWTIVVNIVLDGYATIVDLTRSMLSHNRQKIRVQKNPKAYSFDIHWEELNRLDKIIGELEDDYKSFRNYYLRRR